MTRLRIPNTATLATFEAAARHGSFTQAARELHLSESAVSRQIAGLESSLGVALFVRARQRVALTRAGELYSQHVRRALEGLSRDTLSVIAQGGGAQQLDLAVLPAFASEWLIPRLGRFQAQAPDVQLNMEVRTTVFDLSGSHFDAAIHYGQPTWPRARAEYLFDEDVVPVCAPGLLKRRITRAQQLLDYPLMHSSTRPEAWNDWFRHHGVDDDATMRGVRYELHSMLISAAVAGLGVALVPLYLVRERLQRPGLQAAFKPMRVANAAYYLVSPEAREQSAALQAFQSWLAREVREAGEPRRA